MSGLGGYIILVERGQKACAVQTSWNVTKSLILLVTVKCCTQKNAQRGTVPDGDFKTDRL